MVKGIEFEYEVLNKPTFSYVNVSLKKGQMIQCEGGTMIFFDPSLEISTKKASSGFLKSLKRVLAGETFFMNTFNALDMRAGFYLADVLLQVQYILKHKLTF
jgi:uncharacterized protein (AIM24 family)